MAFEIALTILGIVLTVGGLVGSLSNAFRFLLLLRSGGLREDQLPLAVARICKLLAVVVGYVAMLLAGLSQWHNELHIDNFWWDALLLAGFGIYTIGYFSEKLSSRSR